DLRRCDRCGRHCRVALGCVRHEVHSTQSHATQTTRHSGERWHFRASPAPFVASFFHSISTAVVFPGRTSIVRFSCRFVSAWCKNKVCLPGGTLSIRKAPSLSVTANHGCGTT